MICLCYVDIFDIRGSNDGPMSSLIPPHPVDRTERKRQRERERYAHMSTEKKAELLERNRAYRQRNLLAGKECTFNYTIYMSIIA